MLLPLSTVHGYRKTALLLCCIIPAQPGMEETGQPKGKSLQSSVQQSGAHTCTVHQLMGI